MMPFGGYKQSGIGKEFGSEAIYAYVVCIFFPLSLVNIVTSGIRG